MAEGLTFAEIKREYMKMFFGLLIFTALTVVASWDWVPHSWGHWGTYLHVGVGLVVAFIKAAMVVWIFMHIKFDHPYLRITIAVPLFLFGVMIFALTVLGL